MYKIGVRNEIMCSKGGRGMNLVKPKSEVESGIRELSSGAYHLLDIYYTLYSGWDFVDSVMAHKLNVGIRRYKTLRKELIDKGYLYIAKGPEVDNYYVGKSAVKDFLSLASNSKSKFSIVNKELV